MIKKISILALGLMLANSQFINAVRFDESDKTVMDQEYKAVKSVAGTTLERRIPTSDEVDSLVKTRYLPVVVSELDSFDPYVEVKLPSARPGDPKEYNFPPHTLPAVASSVLNALRDGSNKYDYSSKQRIQITQDVRQVIGRHLEDFRVRGMLVGQYGRSSLGDKYYAVSELARTLIEKWKVDDQQTIASSSASIIQE